MRWIKYQVWIVAPLCMLVLWLAMDSAAAPPRPELPRQVSDEPIVPLLSVGQQHTARTELGGRLFRDRRLSSDGSRSCSTCHDLAANGASVLARDIGMDGKPLSFNTPTVFNAALNFRFNWEGRFRTLEEQAAASLLNPQIMGSSPEAVVAILAADAAMARRFMAAYNHGPDVESLLDAIASFQRSLITPNSRFDRWLDGEADALAPLEIRGYELFKSLGCISCHQGANIGGNLFSRHGLFKPLVSPKLDSSNPPLLRVPSLRNIAITAPYFHDGSAATLEDAIRRMARSQLNAGMTAVEIASVAAFLRTLTGERRDFAGATHP